MELIWELQMDVEYSFLHREIRCCQHFTCWKSFFAQDVGFKNIKGLSKLYVFGIITELETLWNFMS